MDISIASPAANFENHLHLADNHRIIFSGKFGMGKTYFLKSYFAEERHRYNTICISPVNYVVSSNENIFELIKADILKELFLTKKIRLKILAEDTRLQKISGYIEKTPLTLARFLGKFLSRINPAVETPIMLLEEIGKIYKDYQQASKVGAKDLSLTEEAAAYLDAGENIAGSIYEYNYITRAINVFLDEIRDDKKNVLIIDDLDRVDPEHIFRILNILSAHNNTFNTENKFHFDHIIIVCDIDNIRKIFIHKYGPGVDFDGYIDKFFSTDIFHFQNNDAIKLYISETFGTKEDTPVAELTSFVLQSLIDHRLLTVRGLLKHRFEIRFKNFIIVKGLAEDLHLRPAFIENAGGLYIDSTDLPILAFFKLMSLIYGNFEDFHKDLQRLSEIHDKVQYDNLRGIAAFLALQYHIITAQGKDLFFCSRNKGTAIEQFDIPETTISGNIFKIKIAWDPDHPYRGKNSYFTGAVGVRQFVPSIKDIFEFLKEIAYQCYVKGYLRNAGIHITGLKYSYPSTT